jgi:parvulin-like peptidyl-prolyl isomerase
MRHDRARYSPLVAVSFACLAVLSCGPERDLEGEDPVLATYRTGEIRQSDLDAWRSYRPMLAGSQTEERFGISPPAMAALVAGAADLAVESGLDDDPRIAFLLRREENSLLSDALKERLTEEVALDASEVEALLAEHDSDRQKPEKRQLSYIVKRVPAGGGAAAREATRRALEAIRARLLEGADFAETARLESDSQTRDQGGRLGTFPRAAMPGALAEAAFALAEGELSEVLETSVGFALVRCDAIIPARVMSLEEARSLIEGGLRRREGERTWGELVRSLSEGVVDHDIELLGKTGGYPEEVVSRFGSGTLTRRQIDWLLPSAATEQAAAVAGARQRQVRTLLDGYALRFLVAEEARRRGLDREPEVVSRLSWSRRAGLTKAVREARLEALLTPPGEDEVRAHYEEMPQRFQAQPQFRLAVLWDGAQGEPRLQAYERLERAVGRIRVGEMSFGTAARAVSKHPLANEEGEIGWRTRKQAAALGPAALRAIQGLQPGELSDVVEEPAALWVFKLLERREARQLPWAEAREAARASLEQRRRAEQSTALMRRLLDELAVEVAAS